MLLSTVFQWRPGVEREANFTFTKDQVVWEPGSAARATQPCTGAEAGQVGCFTAGGGATATEYTVNLLNTGELYGEGYSIFDLKIGKNLPFPNKGLHIGVDIFNLFNNDKATEQLEVSERLNGAVNPRHKLPTDYQEPRSLRMRLEYEFGN